MSPNVGTKKTKKFTCPCLRAQLISGTVALRPLHWWTGITAVVVTVYSIRYYYHDCYYCRLPELVESRICNPQLLRAIEIQSYDFQVSEMCISHCTRSSCKLWRATYIRRTYLKSIYNNITCWYKGYSVYCYPTCKTSKNCNTNLHIVTTIF